MQNLSDTRCNYNCIIPSHCAALFITLVSISYMHTYMQFPFLRKQTHIPKHTAI
jgi:hypothetical protein